MTELVKDCACPVGAMTGQLWWEEAPPRDRDRVTFVVNYEPRLACMQCHRPWVPRIVQRLEEKK